MQKKPIKYDILTLLLVLSCAAIVVGAVGALLFYRQMFDGYFSSESADWSNFGSYIGGLLGPAISFVTLLAVLKTVYLQRELLDAQGAEFERMHTLQQDTFKSQQLQMALAHEQAKSDEVERSRVATLAMVDRWISFVERKLDRSTEGLNRVGDWTSSGSNHVTKEQTQKLADNNSQLRGVILELMGLSERISLNDYNSAKEIQEFYDKEVAKIFLPKSS